MLAALPGCDPSGGDGGGGGKADEIGDGEALVFDFSDGDDRGFQAIFRDLPEEIHAEYLRRTREGLDLGPVAPLPGPLVDIEADTTHWMLHDGVFPMPDGIGGSGVLVQSTNRSDDIDMYIVKELGPEDGVAPDTTYDVTFLELALAGDAPVGALGVGGAPALGISGVATATDPMPFVVDELDHVRHPPGVFAGGVGVEIGTNGSCLVDGAVDDDGRDLEPCPAPPARTLFRLNEFTPDATTQVTTGPEGRFWVMIGGHSGFEGFSAIYYQRLVMRFAPAAP
ncbi:MAG TPA: hypothetical protein VFU21_32860 [Kofleriaceae bacterium]|nr:hypothetical protein [Kofleriaceae bacterium]